MEKMWTVSRLSSPWHFDVSSVIAFGLWPLSLEGFDMKSRLGSQVYPMASDPGLKQSTSSLWDTVTSESEAPTMGASSVIILFLPSKLKYFRCVD